jgi:PAS domain S-box-containing protein
MLQKRKHKDEQASWAKSVVTGSATSISLLKAFMEILRQGVEGEVVRLRNALERKTEELANSLVMMRATLESTTDAIVMTDGANKVTGFNEKYVEMLGVSRETIQSAGVGKLREIFSRRFKNPEEFISKIMAIYASSPPETFDIVEFVDGRVFERYSKLQQIDNRTVGRVWTFRDITERKRAAERLEAAKTDAEKASKAKDDFLAVLSHELRTPLTPALAAASYLAEHENLLPEFREELTAIWRNVQLEARLIDDLLDLTRITRGKIELRHEPVDAHRSLRDALQIVSKDILDKEIELEIELNAVRRFVWADPVRIQQVLWNLINNAAKFTNKKGRIAIRTLNEGDRFVFEIQDSGIGIDPEKQRHIFKAFEQGDPSISRQFGGLGLGLAISKTLLDLHGGTISVHSRGKNMGASFKVVLDAVDAPAPVSSAHNGREPGLPRSLRVLIVDDHADTRRILSRLLIKCGHKVDTVESARDALKILNTQRFDALISDIGLPDTSGYELVREAKRRQPLNGIALSGFGTEDDIRRSMEAGFDYHLTKPVNFQDLRSLLEKIAS